MLRRRLWLIVLCVVAVAGAAVAFSLSQENVYSAKSWLLFRDPAVDRNLFQAGAEPNVDADRQAATNLELVSLPDVALRAARELDAGLSGRQIERKVSVSAEGQSDVVTVTATDNDPAFAATLANVFSTEFIATRREVDQAVLREAQELVQGRLQDLDAANREALESRADDLKILAALQTGKVEQVQRATPPTGPSSPKPVRNGVLGGLFGLLLGVGLVALVERLDRRIRDPHELEETYGLPILGAIPESKKLRKAGKGSDVLIFGPELEAFRKLRAKLRYFNVDRDVRTVMITSASPGEGKTTVAANLALAAAISGQARVLLLEADLRLPSLAEKLKLHPVPGLAELLTHDLQIEEVTQRLAVPTWNGTEAGLDVIVAGAQPPNPAELLDSRRMVDLLKRLEATYDVLILDTPPLSVVADPMPLMRHVGGVIAVSWLGVSTRDQAMHLHREFESFNAPVLGVVLNRVKGAADSYYGQGYARDQLEQRELERTR